MKTLILHVLCEGPTEERFVGTVLNPFLRGHDIIVKHMSVSTNRKKGKRGGLTTFEKIKNDLELLFKQNSNTRNCFHIFTTMFDFYALPNDFPKYVEAMKIHDKRGIIDFLEKSFYDEVGNKHFIPYIQLHEFEALLFVDIERLKDDYPKSSRKIDQLKKETDKISDPEMINNHPDSAPSKRIENALSNEYNYNKVKSGPSITQKIGMDRLLEKCMHFRDWIEKIIALKDCTI